MLVGLTTNDLTKALINFIDTRPSKLSDIVNLWDTNKTTQVTTYNNKNVKNVIPMSVVFHRWAAFLFKYLINFCIFWKLRI